MTKARLIYLLLVASVFAYALAFGLFGNIHGTAGGGSWMI